MNTRLTRTRWAAIGAAVAVSLGAGGFGLAGAVSSGERPVTITVEPERILDTRINLGLPGPFVPNTPRDVQVTGSVPVASGPAKIVVPTDAVAVVVNVTVVNPSRSGFLSLRPGGAAGTPLTSTVNFTTGSDEPNAATVDLGPGGTVQVYVHAATAHVVLDVVGYTVDHDHDDRYLQSKEVDTAIANSNAVAFASATPGVDLSPAVPTTLVTLDITVPVDGVLIVNGNANILGAAGIAIDCWINIDDPAKNSFHGVQHQSVYVDEWADNLGFDVTAGDHTLYLGCQQMNGIDTDTATVQVRRMTSVFSANSL